MRKDKGEKEYVTCDCEFDGEVGGGSLERELPSGVGVTAVVVDRARS